MDVIEYALPGARVREFTVPVPLDWEDPTGRGIEVFVRELVDPERRRDDLPLLTYLQGGPGGANPRPTAVDGWLAEALTEYRVVMVDQRGTGRSSPVDGDTVSALTGPGAAAGYLLRFRADSIVRDLEHVRRTCYDGRRWATLAQSYGGWLTLTYLSTAPEGLAACYVCGGIPGLPPDPAEVYRRTFGRVESKTRQFYERFPQDVAAVARIADHLAETAVTLPDGSPLSVRRFQTLGQELGFGQGAQRLHWLVSEAFSAAGRLTGAFLEAALVKTSTAGNPLFWTLQESIYGDGGNGPFRWAAQRERDRRPRFAEDQRPLLFTSEMAFPWMFREVRALRPFARAAEELAEVSEWSALYDPARLAANEVPLAAAVYADDVFVDAGLQWDTLAAVGSSRHWTTNEHEHDGIRDGTVFRRLRNMVRDVGGEHR
ncbi:alpha/beta hydrolase [Paenibacillus sp. TRM 82003]|uniref:alpha/beta fold hydrolase n=1 Tax=Kineococcus sp. TRM81007 TaxID=2925831 RepID=UPI001F598605|nr:alpha/beta fold hydrolase [Kineococcus sp. TRM81007]MCI2239566.1 alpha/beta hydrolase [Kineococcus sp. TRM81007]MCI3926152.1 alpha/beta hydrolase [Paenibacillus sp. TRM 82003]